MRVVSTYEFSELTKERSSYLHMIAKTRYDQEPAGFVRLQDLERYASAVQARGDNQDTIWLQNLAMLAKSGDLNQIRTGNATAPMQYKQHIAEVHSLVAQTIIPFGINDMIIVKDTGIRGTVVDYNVDSKRYIVALNPFQIRDYAAEDLIQGKGS